MDWILNTAVMLLGWLWQIANSTFFVALISAAAGAFAGAYGAQHIALKTGQRRRLDEEVRNTNAAIMVAFELTTTLLSMKDQHVNPMKENFDKQMADFRAHMQELEKGAIPREQKFGLAADFQTIGRVEKIAVEILRSLVFEKISVGGRPLVALARLSRVIDGLNDSIRGRSEVCRSCKEHGSDPAFDLQAIYFGVPDADDNIDTTFPDTIKGIAMQTDDGIYFSNLIAEDLVEHGEKLIKAYKENPPHINRPDFSKAEEQGLAPNPDLYADWEAAFRKHPEED